MTEILENNQENYVLNTENDTSAKVVKTIKIANSANIFESNYKTEKEELLKEKEYRKNNFYYLQGRIVKFEFIIKMFFSSLLILGSIAGVLTIYLQQYEYSLFAIPTFFGFIGFVYGIILTINHVAYKNDLKTLDIHNESRVVVPSLTKIYRKITTRNIDTNWFCSGVYFFGIITILVTLISVWAINEYENNRLPFGILTIGSNNVPEIFVYTLTAIIILTFIYHITVSIFRQWRINKFDTFYGFQIVSQPEIDDIKKAKQKRDKWIFVFLIIITLFLFWLVYHYVFKKRFNLQTKKF